MASTTRRIDIRELGERACTLIREVHDSGDEVVLVDGDEEMVVMRPATPDAEAGEPDWDNWDPADREAWTQLLAIRADVTKNWISPLSAAEAVEEQRR
jgi:hypothetical protein